jgi:hypothetical protein
MWTSTLIAVTEIMSAAYVSLFIQIYLFIRTYMSALVDIIPDYKKCHEIIVIQKSWHRPCCRKLPVSTGYIFPLTLQVISEGKENKVTPDEDQPESLG